MVRRCWFVVCLSEYLLWLQPGVAHLQEPRAPHFEIMVSDPIKQGEGVNVSTPPGSVHEASPSDLYEISLKYHGASALLSGQSGVLSDDGTTYLPCGLKSSGDVQARKTLALCRAARHPPMDVHHHMQRATSGVHSIMPCHASLFGITAAPSHRVHHGPSLSRPSSSTGCAPRPRCRSTAVLTWTSYGATATLRSCTSVCSSKTEVRPWWLDSCFLLRLQAP